MRASEAIEDGAPLPPAVSGERFETTGVAGRVACYVAGSGPPLLLVHSVNTAASAAEVRPLHEHYRATNTSRLRDESNKLNSVTDLFKPLAC